MVEETFIPCNQAADLDQELLIEGSLFKTLISRYDIDVTSMVQEIRSKTCNQQTAALLDIPRQTPVLHILRRYGSSRNGCYLYSSIHCDTNKFAISSFN